MKEPQKRSAWLVGKLLMAGALLLAAGCATTAPVPNGGVLSAKVVRLKGAARCSTGGDVWQQLKTGDIVKPGTCIQTDAKSRVDLVFGTERHSSQPSSEQSTLRIWGDSLLGIDKLTIKQTGMELVTDTELDLKAGHIYGVVKKMSAASKYEVKLPNGVAGIRGTEFDITAKGEVKVWSGSVVLAIVGPDGSTQTQVIMGSPKGDASLSAQPSTAGPGRNWAPSRKF
jgi:hypothetical protein